MAAAVNRHKRQKSSYPERKKRIKAYCSDQGLPRGPLKHAIKARQAARARYQHDRQQQAEERRDRSQAARQRQQAQSERSLSPVLSNFFSRKRQGALNRMRMDNLGMDH